MNEIPVSHPSVGGTPATRRIAEPKPDQSFLETVEALLGGVGLPARDGDPARPKPPMRIPAEQATETADGETVPEPGTADVVDLSLLVMPQSPRTGTVPRTPAEPLPVLTAPRVVETQGTVPLPPADSLPSLPVARAAAPLLTVGPAFVPPVVATAPDPIRDQNPADAIPLLPEVDLPERPVAIVTRVETHFAPVAIPPVADPRAAPPLLQPGLRPEPVRTSATKPLAQGVSAERRADSPAAPAAPLAAGLPSKAQEVPGAIGPRGDDVVDLPAAGTESGRPSPSRREPMRFDPPPLLRSERAAAPSAEANRTEPVPAPATAAGAALQPGAMPERLAGADLPRVSAFLADALRTPTLPSPPAGDGGQSGPLRIVALTLDPEHLGRVKLTIRMAGDRLSLHVAAERPETAEMIENDAEALSRLLGAEGFDVESLTATPLRESAGILPAPPNVASGAGFADPGASGSRAASQQASDDGQRRPAHQDSNENGSAPHEEADAPGRDGRIYV